MCVTLQEGVTRRHLRQARLLSELDNRNISETTR